MVPGKSIVQSPIPPGCPCAILFSAPCSYSRTTSRDPNPLNGERAWTPISDMAPRARPNAQRKSFRWYEKADLTAMRAHGTGALLRGVATCPGGSGGRDARSLDEPDARAPGPRGDRCESGEGAGEEDEPKERPDRRRVAGAAGAGGRETVNLAGRMESEAPNGGTHLTEATCQPRPRA
jgi:hypothetical protein